MFHNHLAGGGEHQNLNHRLRRVHTQHLDKLQPDNQRQDGGEKFIKILVAEIQQITVREIAEQTERQKQNGDDNNDRHDNLDIARRGGDNAVDFSENRLFFHIRPPDNAGHTAIRPGYFIVTRKLVFRNAGSRTGKLPRDEKAADPLGRTAA